MICLPQSVRSTGIIVCTTKPGNLELEGNLEYIWSRQPHYCRENQGYGSGTVFSNCKENKAQLNLKKLAYQKWLIKLFGHEYHIHIFQAFQSFPLYLAIYYLIDSLSCEVDESIFLQSRKFGMEFLM
jgi:hypothetical protein